MRKLITSMILAGCSLPVLSLAKTPKVSLNSSELMFMENKGQLKDQHGRQRKDVQFKLAAEGLNVFIGDGQLHYQWHKDMPADKKIASYRADIELKGANKHAQVIAEDQQEYVEKYYSNEYAQGVTTHTYKKITYKDIYPNIDWVLYIKDNKLEYDFVVKPGGQTADIKLKYSGATALVLAKNGSVHITTPMGSITEQAPVSYVQQTGTKVASRFVLNDDVLSFNTAPHKGTLVIDPTLSWATQYGTANPQTPYANYVTCDAAGNVYLAGGTQPYTYDVATQGSFLDTAVSGTNISYLAKFNSDGQRQWGTFIADSSGDAAINNLTCDKDGNLYIVGTTASGNLLGTPGTFQSKFAGGGDAYLVKFDGNGTRLWGTYCGREGSETGTAVSCDNNGNVFLSGTSRSSSDTTYFATQGAFLEHAMYAVSGVDGASFVEKLNGTTGQRIWGTYLGGGVNGSACDPNGNVYVTGMTTTLSNISSPGSFQEKLGAYIGVGTLVAYGAFLVKFDAANGQRAWGTYYGGTEWGNGRDTYGTGVASDLWGNIYITGYVQSNPDSFLTTANAFQTSFAGGASDGFVAKFDTNGRHVWGTLYGGNSGSYHTDDENISRITCDVLGNIYISGTTNAIDGIASAGAYDSVLNWGRPGVPAQAFNYDAFLAKLDSSGQHRLWGTYFGGKSIYANADGSSSDYGNGVACDAFGNVYMSGGTQTDSIATPGSFSDGLNWPVNTSKGAYLVKFHDCTPPPANIISAGKGICQDDSLLLAADTSTAGLSYQWLKDGVNIPNANTNTYAATDSGVYTLVQTNALHCADTSAADTLKVLPLPTPVLSASHHVVSTTTTYASYQWYYNGQLITGATQQSYTADKDGSYYVVVTDSNGCSKQSTDTTLIPTGVATINSLSEAIHIYPNPATSIVNIEAPVSVNIFLVAVDGRTVLQENNAKTIDISKLADGVYTLRLTDNDGATVKIEKLVKTAN